MFFLLFLSYNIVQQTLKSSLATEKILFLCLGFPAKIRDDGGHDDRGDDRAYYASSPWTSFRWVRQRSISSWMW
jgi:hypothetical protein